MARPRYSSRLRLSQAVEIDRLRTSADVIMEVPPVWQELTIETRFGLNENLDTLSSALTRITRKMDALNGSRF